ncbi:hypothetical protein AB1Y20_010450 [Prymnesium parvum]|uniref:EF-hand domain-containing protein n=1 Tax=Prymnesium parvum TaxID=97485 RepID=A0AB34IRG4_PRYPA
MRSSKKQAVISPDVPIEKPVYKPSADEVGALTRETLFDEPEIRQLAQRFSVLDNDGSGTLTADELYNLPELSMYPLLKRVLSMHNDAKTGVITFAEFVKTMSVLSGKATIGEKLKFTFTMFDVNGNGHVQPSELFKLLRMMTGRLHDDADLQQIVNALYRDRFTKGIDFETFKQMFTLSDLAKLTLNV